MNLDAINGSLFLRFAAVLAAYVQDGPDLGVVQKVWSATVSCLNEFVLDAFPVTLLTGASQIHSGLIHFQSFFLRMFERARPVLELSQCPEGESPYDVSDVPMIFMTLCADGSFPRTG
jgi:hypothetical protein